MKQSKVKDDEARTTDLLGRARELLSTEVEDMHRKEGLGGKKKSFVLVLVSFRRC